MTRAGPPQASAAAISAAAKRGLKLVITNANCIGCHSCPLLSDQKFHSIKLAAEGPTSSPLTEASPDRSASPSASLLSITAR